MQSILTKQSNYQTIHKTHNIIKTTNTSNKTQKQQRQI